MRFRSYGGQIYTAPLNKGMTHSVGHFPHGLGDHALFAHALSLWTKRGVAVRVSTDADLACLFKAAGCEVVTDASTSFPYWQSPTDQPTRQDWQENKLGWNLSQLPVIGLPEDLWPEVQSVKLDLRPYLTAASKKAIDKFLKPLGKVILIHTQGNTGKKEKDCPDELGLYRELLDRTDCTLLLLDWDSRVTRLHHPRIRHLTDDFRKVSVPELAYLIEKAELLIGVDSGPLHLSRVTDTPAIGLWYGHQPSRYALPRANTVHLVPYSQSAWTAKRRSSFHLVDVPSVTGKVVADVAVKVLAGTSAADLALDGVLNRLRYDDNGPAWKDRHHSFRAALDRLKGLEQPRILETGCVRQAEDWSAGYSTYVFGLFLKTLGKGLVTSVDYDDRNVNFAREQLREFGPFVEVVCGDSLAYMKEATEKYDLIYLDSWDTHYPGHDEHALAEAREAVRLLSPGGTILIDDCWYRGQWQGKGATAVPWLTSQGFRITHQGYQVLLERPSALSGQQKV